MNIYHSSYNQQPQDWVRITVTSTTDLGVLLRIWHKGTEAAAHISVSGTTGDITFEQGATTGAADTTTGDNPQVGATPGVIDLSSLVPVTYKAIELAVNATDDWECQLISVLPEDVPEAAGAGDFIASTDEDATDADGAPILNDISKSKAEYAALTFNNGPDVPHNHDANVLHELLEVKSKITFTGAATLKVFRVDDVAGTSVEVLDIGAAATTVEKAYPGDSGRGEPIQHAKSLRLVVKTDAVTTLTVSSLFIGGRSYAYGPGIRKGKLESAF